MRTTTHGDGALSRRVVMIGGLSLGAFSAVAPGPAGAQSAPVTLSAPEAEARAAAGEILLIDVRTPGELAASGSPAAAAHVDMRSPEFGQQLMALVDGDQSRPVAFICASGARSGRVSSFLAANGFTDVYDVSEGMMGSQAGPGWLARGLPIRSVGSETEN